MKRYMYHCPDCKKTEETVLTPLSTAHYRCKNCRKKLRSSGLTPEQWAALSEAEQARVYDLPYGAFCENKRFFNMVLVALCAVLSIVTWIAPVLGTFEVQPPVLLACAAVYLVIYDYDVEKKFRKNGEQVLAQLKTAAETEEVAESQDV